MPLGRYSGVFTGTGHKKQQVMRRAGSFSQWRRMEKKVTPVPGGIRKGKGQLSLELVRHTLGTHSTKHSMPHRFWWCWLEPATHPVSHPKGGVVFGGQRCSHQTRPPAERSMPHKESAKDARGYQISHKLLPTGTYITTAAVRPMTHSPRC